MKDLGRFIDYTDNSLKSVFQGENNEIIEMTLLFNKAYDVVCVPTHHFCNLGCKMCHLTNNSLNKKMVKINIDNFMESFMKTITVKETRITNKENLLISFMGVGEPLLNLELIENVYKNQEYIKNKFGYKSVNYAISTMMPNRNVTKLTDMVNENNIPLKLHFSLHTPIDAERKELIPSTSVTVDEALSLLNYYKNIVIKNDRIVDEYSIIHRTNNPIEIHYTLINGVNDSVIHLDHVCRLLSTYDIPIKFIRFNPINNMRVSGNEIIWIYTIKKQLPSLRVKTYTPPGREIGSSCGEFTKHYYHEEIETKEELKEFINWKECHQISDENLKLVLGRKK